MLHAGQSVSVSHGMSHDLVKPAPAAARSSSRSASFRSVSLFSEICFFIRLFMSPHLRKHRATGGP